MADSRQEAINKRTGATPDNVSFPSQDDLSNYDVKSYSYPEDLSSDPRYGTNKVMFFINVQGGGRIAVKDDSKLLSSQGVTSRYSGSRVSDVKKEVGEATASVLKSTTDTLNNTAKSIGLDGNFNTTDTQNKILKATQSNKRLKAAIALYMPEALTKAYSVSWNESDGDEFMSSAANATALSFAANKLANNTGGPELTDVLKAKAGSVAGRMLNGMQYTQKALGITPGNSNAELLFKQVDFGGISFDYRFAPRSEGEAANVLKIIRMFRHHMLPEYFDKQNFLYIYPSEFEIRYYRDDKENKFLERHITCVLTNLTINYNPNGQFTTFENGMPTHINLTLTFKELGVPTKETSPFDESGA